MAPRFLFIWLCCVLAATASPTLRGTLHHDVAGKVRQDEDQEDEGDERPGDQDEMDESSEDSDDDEDTENEEDVDMEDGMQTEEHAVPNWCEKMPEGFGADVCNTPEGDCGCEAWCWRMRSDLRMNVHECCGCGGLTMPANITTLEQCGDMDDATLMEHAVCDFSAEHARIFAYFATAAYCNVGVQEWECGTPCENLPKPNDIRGIMNNETGIHAIVAKIGDHCGVAFNLAPENLTEWAKDIPNWKMADVENCKWEDGQCQVVDAFQNAYSSVAENVKATLEELGCGKDGHVALTGHGIGGVLATLAAWDLHHGDWKLARVFTFGQPRMGNEAFAKAFNDLSLRFYRVARADDPLIYVPAQGPFHHIGTEVFYRGDTLEGYRLCDGSGEDRTCSPALSANDLQMLWGRCRRTPEECGHFLYMQPMTEGLMSRASCEQ